jgi:hypothetical protein
MPHFHLNKKTVEKSMNMMRHSVQNRTDVKKQKTYQNQNKQMKNNQNTTIENMNEHYQSM